MHWVQAFIASEKVFQNIREEIPHAVICPLPQNLFLLPITLGVESDLQEKFAAMDPHEPLAEEIAPGVAGLAAKLSSIGPLVYAATFIHGGTGGQDALVWINGELVLKLHDNEDKMSQWPDSPISRELRYLGVTTKENQDEFDALGLGKENHNDSWTETYINDLIMKFSENWGIKKGIQEDAIYDLQDELNFYFPEEYRALLGYSDGGVARLKVEPFELTFYPIDQRFQSLSDARREIPGYFVFGDDGNNRYVAIKKQDLSVVSIDTCKSDVNSVTTIAKSFYVLLSYIENISTNTN